MDFDGTFGFSEIVTVCAIVVGAFWFVKSGIAIAVTHDECDERCEPLQAHVSKLALVWQSSMVMSNASPTDCRIIHIQSSWKNCRGGRRTKQTDK